MNNEIIFIIQAVVSLGLMLFMLRLGKEWVMILIVASVILMNTFVIKGVSLFGLDVTTGNILYATVFLGTDMLAEFYGKKEAFKAVRMGFFASVFFLFIAFIVVRYEPGQYDFAHGSLKTVFQFTPRIVIGSMIAYLASQHLDVYLYEKFNKWTKGKYLWLRNNGSTWISQFVDSILFSFIAFYGVFPNLLEVMAFIYVIKVMIAALDTPFMYLSLWVVKKERVPKQYKHLRT
ncbi:MAG: queuosine precursor transporter [bacterium]